MVAQIRFYWNVCCLSYRNINCNLIGRSILYFYYGKRPFSLTSTSRWEGYSYLWMTKTRRLYRFHLNCYWKRSYKRINMCCVDAFWFVVLEFVRCSFEWFDFKVWLYEPLKESVHKLPIRNWRWVFIYVQRLNVSCDILRFVTFFTSVSLCFYINLFL